MAGKRATADTLTQYRLYLLGGFRLERDGKPISLARAKAKPLLAYLALFPQEHRREKIAADLWLDSTDADARLSLRVTLNSLRSEISPDLVLADRETLQLNPDFPIWTDAREFSGDWRLETGDSIARLQSLVSLYRGDLLPELYDEWLIPERERLREAFLEIALRGVEMARGASDYANGIEIAQHILRTDRAHETAHQHLIFCFAATGNRAAALKQFEECELALREELGVEPSPETRALLERVTQNETRAKSPAAALTNLPKPLTSFVGRERELQELRALLGKSEAVSDSNAKRTTAANENASPLRAVTLVGAGGSGKTRLAIQAARELMDEYKHGVWFIDLAPLADETLVPQTIAKALGIQVSANQAIADALANFLRRRNVLLVLDNCEHVIDVCAQIANQLITQSPHLQILATSREALNIGGEQVYAVPTLTMPTAKGIRNWNYPAVQLFVERAQAAKSDFRMTEQNAHTVVDICRRLDGMPLAIELAAARMKMLSPQEIAARLDKRFDLLSGGSRGVLPRQQTLRALLDWSFDLLSDQERVLLRRLAVFAGGWTLKAAEQICADDREIEGTSDGEQENASLHHSIPTSLVLDLLSNLVEKSLVVVDTSSDTTRYQFLETIREYAHEKLLQANERERLDARHLDYFIALAEQAEPELYERNQLEWMQRLEQDYDNFRVALRWTRASKQDLKFVQLSGALGYFWYLRGYLREAGEWLPEALAAMDDEMNLLWRARAWSAAGTVAWAKGEFRQAEQFHSRALTLYRNAKHDWGTAFSLINVAAQESQLGENERAEERLDAALSIARDKFANLHSIVLINTAVEEMQNQNYVDAHPKLLEALAITSRNGFPKYQMHAATNLAEVQLILGETEKAIATMRMTSELAKTMTGSLEQCEAFNSFAFILVKTRDWASAEIAYLEAMQNSLQTSRPAPLVKSLEGIGVLDAHKSRWRSAARLWGCAAKWRESHNFLFRQDIPNYDESVQAARQALGEAQFDLEWQRGAEMEPEDVAERVLRREF